MISWRENTDFEVCEKKKQKTLVPVERKPQTPGAMREGAILFLSFRITPEGQLMKGTSWWGYPKLLQAV